MAAVTVIHPSWSIFIPQSLCKQFGNPLEISCDAVSKVLKLRLLQLLAVLVSISTTHSCQSGSGFSGLVGFELGF